MRGENEVLILSRTGDWKEEEEIEKIFNLKFDY